MSAAASVLSARGLSIGWRERVDHVLASGIDLELKAGDLAVLVGPNGSGKSTLLRTLVGLMSPLKGEVELCGADVRRLTVAGRATRAACVFTDRYDSGYFTVFDVVAFGRYPYTDARNRLRPRDLEAVREAIASVGLTALSERRFAELSDGERQKTLIARAIAQDCPLLVLDEPTAFLDAPARVEIFHLAQSLARSSRVAVVLSTHDIDHALRYADRLWLMDREHRFSAGAPEDLALSGAIGRAFDGEGFRFDAASGTFRSAEAGRPLAVAIAGAHGVSRAWAERLVERLGLGLADEAAGAYGAQPVARITIEESEGGPLFSLKIEGQEGRSMNANERVAASYDELARMLGEVLAEREGKDRG